MELVSDTFSVSNNTILEEFKKMRQLKNSTQISVIYICRPVSSCWTTMCVQNKDE